MTRFHTYSFDNVILIAGAKDPIANNVAPGRRIRFMGASFESAPASLAALEHLHPHA
jgi:hypothetical protein